MKINEIIEHDKSLHEAIVSIIIDSKKNTQADVYIEYDTEKILDDSVGYREHRIYNIKAIDVEFHEKRGNWFAVMNFVRENEEKIIDMIQNLY